MSKRQEILAKVKEVEALPTGVRKAAQLLRDPQVDVGMLSRAIELDPGLTANLLRAANSSYFGGMRTFTSAREAIVRLGSQKVSQLVMASGVMPRMAVEVKGYGLAPGKLLEHAVTTGLAAEQLAETLSIKAPDHAFTAGLLSDVGKVVLGTFVGVDADPILDLAREQGLTFEEAERRVLGIDHAEVGAALLEHWELPESIIFVVRYRLRPDEAPTIDLALDLVHLADVLAKTTGLGLGIDGLNYQPSEAVIRRLGMSTAVLDKAMVRIMENMDELRRIFLN